MADWSRRAERAAEQLSLTDHPWPAERRTSAPVAISPAQKHASQIFIKSAVYEHIAGYISYSCVTSSITYLAMRSQLRRTLRACNFSLFVVYTCAADLFPMCANLACLNVLQIKLAMYSEYSICETCFRENGWRDRCSTYLIYLSTEAYCNYMKKLTWLNPCCIQTNALN